MPPIFKALASITAWILFIGGCMAFLFATIAAIATGEPTKVNIAVQINYVGGVAAFVAAVVVMKLRQMLQ
ncbi:MAG: hypothetical protein HY530_04460 [Chloroflexi bacterium]|nr:hypothetical protein [Chloroflexota bacterium]